MIKPQPYKITCNQCHWSKSFAPKSDVIVDSESVDSERPSQCPKCSSGDITYSPLTNVFSRLFRELVK